MEENIIPVERHPLEPFLPKGAKVLMLGSFPPAKKRWSMEFFYPNWINDMWRIIGHVFFDDRLHFVGTGKSFDKERIIEFCSENGIALYDTACEVRRLKDNASDNFLEVVKATDLVELLEKIPECKAIVTTGQKATDVICEVFGCSEPPVGGWTECHNGIRFWRMPSSSRAYPLPLEKKAEHYRKMFETEGMIESIK